MSIVYKTETWTWTLCFVRYVCYWRIYDCLFGHSSSWFHSIQIFLLVWLLTCFSFFLKYDVIILFVFFCLYRIFCILRRVCPFFKLHKTPIVAACFGTYNVLCVATYIRPLSTTYQPGIPPDTWHFFKGSQFSQSTNNLASKISNSN